MKQFLKSRPTLKVGGLRHSMRGERGAVAIIVAAAMFALLALILLAVQVGLIGTVRALLQGSADQAALAGAQEIDGTASGLAKAQTAAMNILSGGKNFPSALNDGSDLSIAGDAFQTGIWDLTNPAAGFTPSTDSDVVNAVRVRGRKTAALNGPIDMFLGGDFGPDTVRLSRTGVAAVGNCLSLPCKPQLPLATCFGQPCGESFKIVLTPSSGDQDNGAWTGYFGVADAKDLKDMINDCDLIPDVHAGNCISLNNGSVTSAYHELQDLFEAYMSDSGPNKPCPNVRLPDTENPGCALCGTNPGGDPIDIHRDEDGNSTIPDENDCGMPVAIPIIPCKESDVFFPKNCSGDEDLGNFNQTRQVAGFALFVITDVVDTASPKYVEGVLLCGVTFPGTPTGPGPTCSPGSPTCCATQPILVNKNVNEFSLAGD